ncbi:hypothetical protein C8R44DRAFT_992253 [Mycena epipterygia]|nr:hypothetical protein C8R44DRAFT_992253 [Mycena epipterygia]
MQYSLHVPDAALVPVVPLVVAWRFISISSEVENLEGDAPRSRLQRIRTDRLIRTAAPSASARLDASSHTAYHNTTRQITGTTGLHIFDAAFRRKQERSKQLATVLTAPMPGNPRSPTSSDEFGLMRARARTACPPTRPTVPSDSSPLRSPRITTCPLLLRDKEDQLLSPVRDAVLGLPDAARLVARVCAELERTGVATPCAFSALALDVRRSAVVRLVHAFRRLPRFQLQLLLTQRQPVSGGTVGGGRAVRGGS